MTFDVRTEFKGLDPEAQRALVEMQQSILQAFDTQEKKHRRPKRRVTELVEEGSVIARPGEVVRVRPSDEDIEVVLPPTDSGNGGEDIIVSFEGDGTAAGKVNVVSMSGTCASPGETTLNTPGSYRFTSTGAASEGMLAEQSSWSGPAPVSLEDLPVIASQRLLGNNTGAPATPTELTTSQVLDWIGSTRGSFVYRGAAGWAALTPGTIEFPLVSKGAGADSVYQQLATAGIADDAVTNAKLNNMTQSTIKMRTAGAGTGDPQDGTIGQALSMLSTTRGAIPEVGSGSAWTVITPGTSGLPFVSNGAGADPSYQQIGTSAITDAAITSAKLANMAAGTVKGRAAGAGSGVPQDLSGSQLGDILETEALVFTATETFSGEARLGTLHTEGSVAGAFNITLTAGATRVLITSTADANLGTISGCADGRLLLVEYVRASGTGVLEVTHSTASNGIACPHDDNLFLGQRGNMLLLGRTATGTSNWKVIAHCTEHVGEFESGTTSGNIDDLDRPNNERIAMFSPSAALTLRGILAGQRRGDLLCVQRQGTTSTLTVNDGDTNSAAANRFAHKGDANLRLSDDEGALYVYADIGTGGTDTPRWLCVSHRTPFCNTDGNALGDLTRHNGSDWVVSKNTGITAQTSVTNSTTLTVLLSHTVPASYAVAGTAYRVKVWLAADRGPTATASTITFRVRINGSSVVTVSQAVQTTTNTSHNAIFDGTITFITVGATGSIQSTFFTDDDVTGVQQQSYTRGGAGSIDTTSAITIDVTAQFSVAVSSLTARILTGNIHEI